jgi:hypothetical protein
MTFACNRISFTMSSGIVRNSDDCGEKERVSNIAPICYVES